MKIIEYLLTPQHPIDPMIQLWQTTSRHPQYQAHKNTTE
jgi:hypothetical protein